MFEILEFKSMHTHAQTHIRHVKDILTLDTHKYKQINSQIKCTSELTIHSLNSPNKIADDTV